MPMSATVQMMKVQNVIGMYFRRPPMSSFMSKVWCAAWLTEPGAEEQAGLEEGVGEEVEHAGGPGADAEAP